MPLVALPPGLLHDEGDGVGLVDEAQPPAAVARALVGRVEEDAAAHQDPVGLDHERGEPAHVEVALARPVHALHAVVEIEPHEFVPMPVVRGVDGELARERGNLSRRLEEHEAAGPSLNSEDVRAFADAQHQRELRAVDEQPGGELVVGQAAGSLRTARDRHSRAPAGWRRSSRRRG